MRVRDWWLRLRNEQRRTSECCTGAGVTNTAAGCKLRATLGDICLRGGKSPSNMGDTERVSMVTDGDIGGEAPDGGRLILARQASSLVQYAAERGQGGDNMRARAVNADVGVSRLSSVARGGIMALSIPLTRQDSIEGGNSLLSLPAGKIGDNAVCTLCVAFLLCCWGGKRGDT